jgi:hypothetical protein
MIIKTNNGSFKTKEEALLIRKDAEKKYFPTIFN